MTSIVGNSTNISNAGWAMPGSGYAGYSAFTMPSPGGLITVLHGYFDTFSGSGAQGHICIWNSSGTLLVDSGAFTVNNGTESLGGQQWWTHALATPVFIPGGTGLLIGVYCTQNLLFGSGTGGTSFVKSMGSGGPTSFTGGTSSGIGIIEAYAEYLPGNGKTRRGGSWTYGPIIRKTSGAAGVAQVRRGGSWIVGT